MIHSRCLFVKWRGRAWWLERLGVEVSFHFFNVAKPVVDFIVLGRENRQVLLSRCGAEGERGAKYTHHCLAWVACGGPFLTDDPPVSLFPPLDVCTTEGPDIKEFLRHCSEKWPLLLPLGFCPWDMPGRGRNEQAVLL